MYASVVLTRPTHRRPPAGSEPVHEPSWRSQSFTYRLPDQLAEVTSAGQLVQVPLRAGAAIGVIASVGLLPPEGLPPDSIRDVLGILDPLPVVTSLQLDLASWIADTYLAPLSQALRQMLPPGLEDRTFVVVQRRPTRVDGLAAEEAQIVRLLDRHAGRLKLGALLSHLPLDDGEAIVDRLAERGLVETRLSLIPPRAAPPRLQYVSLLADERTLEESLPRLGHPSKQADILLLLARQVDQPLTLGLLCAQAGCTPAVVNALADRAWVRITAPRSLVLALPDAGAGASDLQRAPKQEAALAVLRRQAGPVDLAALGDMGISVSTLRALEQKHLIRRVDEPAYVLLTLPREQVVDKVLELRGGEKERALLEALRGSAGRVWVGGLYAQTGADLPALRRLAERGLVGLHAQAFDRPHPLVAEASTALSPGQQSVWAEIYAGLSAHGTGAQPYAALLHGATGSGKTEIYLKAIEQVLSAGRRALVLLPEISLTAQTLRRYEARFPRRVALLHGQLSLGQRYDVWESVRRGQVDVLLGSRTALFAPISRLGLIVVDEAHDPSYKQEEPIPLPAYHACDVALELGRLSGAVVLLGTATPSLELAFRARQGDLHLLRLPGRFDPSAPSFMATEEGRGGPPPARIADMRQELRAGNRSIFSRALHLALSQTLDAGKQAILYLNRRGIATFVLCRDCGHVARCPQCRIPLSLHLARGAAAESPRPIRPAMPGGLVCHRCNYRQATPSACPECGGRHIRHFGVGTERVETELHGLFPLARLLRWDSDTAAGTDEERYLQPFVNHNVDVLIGTQMIAKGLDLPLVTLVGVISADSVLNLPDFRAGERTFQLLTQVAGRAAPGSLGGQVIFQTYQPEHYAIRAAARHDYEAFYQQELLLRRGLGYPPFSRLLALRYQDTDPARCQDEAQRLLHWLRGEAHCSPEPVDLIGPAPSLSGQIAGRYRWQIVVRAANPAALLHDVILPAGWHLDVDPISLL